MRRIPYQCALQSGRGTPGPGPEAPRAGALDQARHRVPLGRPGREGHLEVHQQAVAVLHQRLAQVAEPRLLARTLAAQPSIRIGPTLVGGVRALVAVAVHPPLAGAAAVRPWRWRGFVLGPEALEAGGRLAIEVSLTGPDTARQQRGDEAPSVPCRRQSWPPWLPSRPCSRGGGRALF